MESEQLSKRQAIVKRIQALMAKTTENGCTEEEAMMAAAKVDELMREHDLAYDDIVKEVRAERYGKRSRPFAGGTHRRRTFHEVSMVLDDVARYFDCKLWYEGADLIFFGEQYDTEMAHNMSDLLRVAMDSEWGRYQRSEERRNVGLHGRSVRMSFMIGMASRIGERLRDMKAARTQAEAKASTTGTALVVVTKQQVVAEKFKGLGIRLKSSSSSRGSGSFSDSAFRAGGEAGGRVDLGGGKLGGKTAGRIAGH